MRRFRYGFARLCGPVIPSIGPLPSDCFGAARVAAPGRQAPLIQGPLSECARDGGSTQPAEVEAKTTRLREKIRTLRHQMRCMERIKRELRQRPDEQLSLTDPESRSMISQAKGIGCLFGHALQWPLVQMQDFVRVTDNEKTMSVTRSPTD